jgi:hypothetical protein
MEFEGRMVDLSDQINRVVGLLFLAVSCWWLATEQARTVESRIPPNKVRIRSLELGILGQSLLCVAAFLVVVVLPWRETKAAALKASATSFNKARLGRWGLETGEASWCSSKRRGGDTKKGQALLRDQILFCLGVMMLQIHEEHSRWPKFWPSTMKTSRWSNLKPPTIAAVSFTSRWRPLFKLAAASLVLAASSGIVPVSDEDGCGWSLSFSSECKGPDCFSLYFSRVFPVKARDHVLFFLFFRVPVVTCTCTV